MTMLRFLIFATLICVAVAKVGNHNRYRRTEGNEDNMKYYRPKYVYKFHEDDSASEEGDRGRYEGDYKTDYQYHLNTGDSWESGEEEEDDDRDESYEHHHHKPAVKYQHYHQEKEPEKVTHYGYAHHSSIDHGDQNGQRETEHHVEIKHEHGTSHQSFKMHHFQPTKLFIKKQDQHYLKKPVEVGVTEHSFKFIHPKKTEKKVETVSHKKNEKELEIKTHVHHPSYYYKDQYSPKKEYKYYQTKEMDVKPKKVVYQEYVKPSYVNQELEEVPPKKKYEFDWDFSHVKKEATPKVEYHVAKEYYKKDSTPKVEYHFPEEYYKKSSPKVEYHIPREYQTVTYKKDSTPKIEYHIPKEYHQHYQQQQHHFVQKPEKHQHYTVYRGSAGSSEEKGQYKQELEEDSSEEPHDIHVYH